MLGRSGVVVSALDFRSEVQWFDAQCLPSCCLLRQETLLHIVFSTQVYEMGTGNILLGVTLQWTSIPILSVASCYINWNKLWPCGPPWLVCDFMHHNGTRICGHNRESQTVLTVLCSSLPRPQLLTVIMVSSVRNSECSTIKELTVLVLTSFY